VAGKYTVKAMIFAAGEGRRMRPLTLETPKPLLRVGNTSLIEHHIHRIKAAGIHDIVINLAYLGQKIKQALGNGNQYGVHIEYSEEPEPLETGGGLYHARNLLGTEPFILVNGDVWTDFDFTRLAAKKLTHLGHLILVPNPEFKSVGDFLIKKNNLLSPVIADGGFTFSGISLLSPNLIEEFPGTQKKFPLRSALVWAMENKKITGEIFSGQWCDVGTPERLAHINNQIF
jgi:N-acetyl-alpha-D-muramate 1-phosphate uridylyltransferase